MYGQQKDKDWGRGQIGKDFNQESFGEGEGQSFGFVQQQGGIYGQQSGEGYGEQGGFSGEHRKKHHHRQEQGRSEFGQQQNY